MENAGSRLTEEILKRNFPEDRVTIFAGTGNNGGDGFVAARKLLNHDIEIDLVLLGRPRDITSSEARGNWQVLTQMEEDIDFYIIRDSKNIQDLPEREPEVLVDALLGTGIRGDIREPVATAVEFINQQDAYTVGVDVPTGLDPETGEVHQNSAKCDLTVTFHDIKSGLEKADEEYTGEIVISDIGIPKAAERKAGPGDVWMAIPPRQIGSHKGQNGRLLIIGGGSQYVGAPALTGMSALRSGTDLVTIAAPSDVAKILNSFSPDLITSHLPGADLDSEALPIIEQELDKATGVVMGPGLGMTPDTKSAIIDIMKIISNDYSEVPVLLDADGLKIVSKNPELLRKTNSVLTPHAGEFKILSGSELPKENRKRSTKVSEVADDLDSPVILKSHTDICAAPGGKVVLNDTGNPGMTVGGTGDVLAGIIGGLLSRGADPFRAGVAGAFLCGLAGDLCNQDMGYEFTASDVKDKIPIAISEVREYW